MTAKAILEIARFAVIAALMQLRNAKEGSAGKLPFAVCTEFRDLCTVTTDLV